jgi:AcrR family transcriptional regulator
MTPDCPTTPHDTATRILYAALDLFAERGFEAVSVREICAAAGVSKPVLYYHFDSRDGVILAVLATLEDGWKTRCALLEDEPPSAAALVTFVQHLFEVTEEHGPIAKLLWRLPTIAPELLTRAFAPERFEAPLVAWLERGVAAGAFPATLDAEAVTLLLLGAFGRSSMIRAVLPRTLSAAELAERLVHATLGLPRPPPPQRGR